MTEMKFIFVFVLPVLFSTTLDRTDKVERFLTEYPSLYWSGILPVTVHTEKMEVYRSDHTCSKTILVSYLGPSRDLYKYVLRSCTLPWLEGMFLLIWFTFFTVIPVIIFYNHSLEEVVLSHLKHHHTHTQLQRSIHLDSFHHFYIPSLCFLHCWSVDLLSPLLLP